MASAASAARVAQRLLGFHRRAPPPLPPLPSPIRRAATRRRGVRMASSAGSPAPPSATVEVPGAAGPVLVVAAPGLPEADFRNAVDSALFKQWLRNLHTEKGALTYGRLNLTRVLIQGVDMFGKRVGFLKFKADIIDEETKAKVPGIVFARGPAVAVLILLESKGGAWQVREWVLGKTVIRVL